MYQQLIIVGNLGKDPEMRYTPSGTPVTSLSVATNRKYTGSDGQVVKETTWFRVSVFGKSAEAAAQSKERQLGLVEGRLTHDKATGGPRAYTRQDGTVGASFEIAANTVRFLSSREAGAAPSPLGGPATGHGVDDVPVGRTRSPFRLEQRTIRLNPHSRLRCTVVGGFVISRGNFSPMSTPPAHRGPPFK